MTGGERDDTGSGKSKEPNIIGPERLFQILEDVVIKPNEALLMNFDELNRRHEIVKQAWDDARKWMSENQSQDTRAAAAVIRGDGDATALHLMCKLHDPPAELVNDLVEASPEAATFADAHGWLPLHHACANGASTNVLEILINAYPKSTIVQDKQNRIPLHFYATRNIDNPAVVSKNAGLLCASGAAKIFDLGGMLPMHYACAYGSLNMLEVLVGAFPESLTAKDNKGKTPVHLVMVNSHRDTSPDVLKFLLRRVGRETVNLVDIDGNLPLDLMSLGLGGVDLHSDFEKQANTSECLRLFLMAKPDITPSFCKALERVLEVFSPPTWDMAYAFSTSVVNHFSFSTSAVASITHTLMGLDEPYFHRLLDECVCSMKSSTVHLILAGERLHSPRVVRWLSEGSASKEIVFFLMIEFYLHCTWIGCFFYAANCFLMTNSGANGGSLRGVIIPLFVVASMFAVLEMRQFLTYCRKEDASAYCFDAWNWLDLCAIGLVIASANALLQADGSDPSLDDGVRHLLMATGTMQMIIFISYLKKAFLPFATFVGGILQIFWKLVPFVVVTGIVLFTFSFLYFAQWKGVEPYATLGQSFLTVYGSFVGGPDDVEGGLDLVFGFMIIIVILNVLIAIVSDIWQDATIEAQKNFLSYRLGFILGVARNSRGCDSSGCLKGLDDFDDFTVHKSGFGKLHYYFSFPILGLFLGGLLWPLYVRRYLFAVSAVGKFSKDEKFDNLEKRIANLEARLERRMDAFEERITRLLVERAKNDA